MRDSVLLVRLKLCHGLTWSILWPEEGVVTKAIVTLWLVTDNSLAVTLSYQHRSVSIDQSNGRVEASSAVLIGNVGKLCQELLIVCSIIAMLASITSRINSRSSVQSVNTNAGVVCNSRYTIYLVKRSHCLDQSVIAERLTVLLWIRKITQLAKRHKAHTRHYLGEDSLNLNKFVSVARRNHHGCIWIKGHSVRTLIFTVLTHGYSLNPVT